MAGSIAERLARVRENVARAALGAGREPEEVLLIAVSKAQPVEAVREAYAAGQRDFGENYVQEFVAKAQALSDLPGIRWHMIGHLQTNKVKQVLPVASWLHTVDRVRLVQELGKRLESSGGGLDVLVEVNVGGEESKTGCRAADAARVVQAVRDERSLRLCGLMTVPPFDVGLGEVEVCFERLREMALGFGVRELSMGMSQDYEVAIAHGATMVRVGTAIFGMRG